MNKLNNDRRENSRNSLNSPLRLNGGPEKSQENNFNSSPSASAPMKSFPSCKLVLGRRLEGPGKHSPPCGLGPALPLHPRPQPWALSWTPGKPGEETQNKVIT